MSLCRMINPSRQLIPVHYDMDFPHPTSQLMIGRSRANFNTGNQQTQVIPQPSQNHDWITRISRLRIDLITTSNHL